MDYLRGCEDNAFDLAIVDPPYGIGGDSLHSNRKVDNGGYFKNTAVQTLNTKWDDSPPNESYFNELKRVSLNQIIWGGNYFNLGRTRGFIVWDKMQPFPNFSACEFAWVSFERPSKLIQIDTRYSGKIHPTQKPVKLYEWLLSNYAKEGDKILDTHLGSGSSAIAAHYGGFDFVGMEIDKDYYDAAMKRFEAETAQLDIFA